MKQIMLDHLRRWWWVWALCLVASAGLFLANSVTNNKYSAVCPFGMFMGAMLLAFDLQRGHARAIVMMPVSARQVGRAWWWVCVGLPAVATTLLITLVFIGFACWRHNWSGFTGCALFCLSNILALGVGFYALTGLPGTCAYSGNWSTRFRGYFFGALWGFSFAGWLLLKNINLTLVTGLGVLSVAVILTAMGWFAAEGLVRERTRLPPGASASRTKGSGQSSSAEGRGGLGFLAQTIFLRMVSMGVAMFVVFALILPFINHFVSDSAASDSMSEMFPIVSVQFLWVMAFQIAGFTMHIRYLRSLPVSTTKLAGVLVLTAAVAMLLIYYGGMVLLSALFRAPVPGPEKIIEQGGLLQIAVATAAVPLFIWRPMEVISFAIIMVLMGGGLFSTFAKKAFPPDISMAVALFVLLGIFVATKNLLERNSRAYRPRTANQFGAWNMGGGR